MTKERKNKLPGLLLILALFCFAGSAEVVCKDKDSDTVGESGSEAHGGLSAKCFPAVTNASGEPVSRGDNPGSIVQNLTQGGDRGKQDNAGEQDDSNNDSDGIQ